MMKSMWTRGMVAALGFLIALPAVVSAHAYTGVVPANVKASLMSTRAHADTLAVKHKHKKHLKHKAAHKSALRSKMSARAKHHRSAAN